MRGVQGVDEVKSEDPACKGKSECRDFLLPPNSLIDRALITLSRPHLI
jgi:hypothetical protein